ncbi:hypothetical protein SAY87_004685 [Trapa incisa]|uniref:WRKY domain-containing protein n=1 Tax=Trapa incisa TaxID=236973 RepID=A0AAN7PN27_9MYRT|nr:hypothetical protein SAY87_004685 [Trapa incisa]
MHAGRSFRIESGLFMDNYPVGDLTDIVRASGGGCPDGKSSSFAQESISWKLPTNHSSSNSSKPDDSADVMDLFSAMEDPLLHGLDSVFFNSISSSMAMSSKVDMSDNDVFVPNMFTRMLQMSAANVNPGHNQLPAVSICSESSAMASSSLVKETKMNTCSSALVVARQHRGDGGMSLHKSKSCLISNGGGGRMQISSPCNSGIKRSRKNQTKKVVCIPAPVAANSRATGEVVPSDLWAWRKYGQKPIKGSPYPRGYYRCSSSKGCPARKQVERSRTDPNMLVITYTSEHNHPWPTHRNALAGSTRSQPSKNSAGGNSVNNLKGLLINAQQVQKEVTEMETDKASSDTTSAMATVKEEVVEDAQGRMDIDISGLPRCYYRPSEPEEANYADEFFADLAEIEGDDPLHLLLNQGFGGDERKDPKGMDPSSIFDWLEEHNLPFGVK